MDLNKKSGGQDLQRLIKPNGNPFSKRAAPRASIVMSAHPVNASVEPSSDEEPTGKLTLE